MKSSRSIQRRPGRRKTSGSGEMAYTLAELMVSVAIFMITVVGFLSIHMYGLRMNELVRAKLGSSDEARRAVSSLVDDVRSAGVIEVGTGTLTSFSRAGNGVRQEGNAIQVYPTKGVTNRFVRYFWDPSDTLLKRTEDNMSEVVVLAHSVTNRLIFTSEDFQGNVLTNDFNNRTIGLMLQFYQVFNPYMAIGPGHYYDYYQLRSKITRRALE